MFLINEKVNIIILLIVMETPFVGEHIREFFCELDLRITEKLSE